MESHVGVLLSQALFLLFPVFFYHLFWMNTDRRYERNSHYAIFIFSAISIFLSMTLSLKNAYGYPMDMRLIPFTIGVLYGPVWVGPALLGFLLTCQWILDPAELHGALFIYPMMYALIFLLSKTHANQNMLEKMKNGAIVTVMFSFLTAIWYSISPFSKIISFMAEFTTNQLIWITCSIYFLETLRKNASYRLELVKNEKLKIVSEIAASVSHEVRNPLTVSRGFIQLLIEQNHLPEEKRTSYLNIVLEELDRAQTIITDYLSFAKPQLPKIERMEASQHVQYIVDVMTPYATMNQVSILTSIEPGIIIPGERTSFRQCLINLVKNAIEASGPNSQIEVRLMSAGDKAVIEVEDHGIGMSQEQMRRLGTPSISTKEKGTGLGMLVVFNTVRGLGGRIEVKSEVNKGTRFRLTFPKYSGEISPDGDAQST